MSHRIHAALNIFPLLSCSTLLAFSPSTLHLFRRLADFETLFIIKGDYSIGLGPD
jgi:hypothetical protein